MVEAFNFRIRTPDSTSLALGSHRRLAKAGQSSQIDVLAGAHRLQLREPEKPGVQVGALPPPPPSPKQGGEAGLKGCLTGKLGWGGRKEPCSGGGQISPGIGKPLPLGQQR